MRRGLLSGLFVIFCISAADAQTAKISDLKTGLEHAVTDSERVSVMIDLAVELKKSGRSAEAKNILNNAQNTAESLSNAYLNQQVTLEYADYYLSVDKPDSAAIILNESLDRYPESKHKSNLLNLLGTAYRYQAKYRQSLDVFNQAKSFVDSSESPRLFGGIKMNMAGVYESLGDMGAALKTYREGLEFAEASKDSIFLATILNNVGNAYNNFGNPEQAEYYLNRSIVVCEAINYKPGLYRSLLNLANTQKGLGDFDSAFSLYNRALTLHGQIRPDTPPFRIAYNIGDLYLEKGDFDSAEEKFNESMRYARELGLPQGIYYNYIGLGAVAEQRNNVSRSLDYFQQALAVAEKLDSAPFRQRVTQKLYQLYKSDNNFERALIYFEEYETISDSLRRIANEQKLAETESVLNLRKEEELNHLLREKQLQQEARISAQNWLIASGIGIIVIILVSLFLLYRANAGKKRINEELVSQRNQLEELNKVKDKILAIIAHDLRSPLASMQGMLYLLREDELSREEIKSMTAELEVSVKQNISMMDNLLVWAKEQMTGLAVNIDSINAKEVVDEVFENSEFQAHYKGIELKNEVSPELNVKADFNLLKLILRNLISNSIKFSREGDKITVRTRQEAGKIIFEVKDTGIGIPEESKKKLFSVESGSRAGTQNEQGSGLGLRLCKEFVEKQNGEIHLESKEGQGTTFFFSLPQAS